MSTPLNSLKSLLGNKPLKLIGAGRSNGTSYTDSERQLAADVAKTILVIAEVLDEKAINRDSIPEEIEEAVTAAAVKFGGLAPSAVGLMRATYRYVEAKRLTDSSTTEQFPKTNGEQRAPRDLASINLIFRAGLKGVVEDTLRDQLFPDYYKSTKSV